jgi:hypothetical protein
MPAPLLATALIMLSALLAFAQPDSQDSADAYLEITAKVVLEDGSPLVSSPMVLLHQPGFESQCAGQQLFKGGTLVLRVRRGSAGCDLSILLTGYRKFTGYVHDGTLITLRRTGPGEGSSVSIVSLNAPANARKEYGGNERGVGSPQTCQMRSATPLKNAACRHRVPLVDSRGWSVTSL